MKRASKLQRKPERKSGAAVRCSAWLGVMVKSSKKILVQANIASVMVNRVIGVWRKLGQFHALDVLGSKCAGRSSRQHGLRFNQPLLLAKKEKPI